MKDIQGFENLYAITEEGRIWSYKNALWMTLRGSGRKYLKILPDEKRKYKTIALWKNKKKSYHYIHRLVAQTFIANPKNLPFVNHIDGNKENNHVSNLEWVTHQENSKHALLNGLTTRGAKNSSTKLTEDKVKQIRKEHTFGSGSIFSNNKGNNTLYLAKKYKVTKGCILAIINRVTWNYL